LFYPSPRFLAQLHVGPGDTASSFYRSHRDDERYWTYDVQFKKQQTSVGHFWAIPPRLPGNGAESDSSRQ